MAAVNTQSSQVIRTDYLQLLIQQLRHQDPLEPLNNNEMAAQLAQMSQLEQMETLNQNFSNYLMTAQMNQAASLVDKQVAFMSDDSEDPVVGRVLAAEMVDGEVVLDIGDKQIALEDILGVSSTYTNMVYSEQVGQISSLIGKQVTFNISENGKAVAKSGTVESVTFSGSRALLKVGEWVVEPKDVMTVSQ